MLWLLLIVTAIAVSYVKFHLYKKRLLKYVGHLPTANDFPLLGIGYRFIGKSTSGKERMERNFEGNYLS